MQNKVNIFIFIFLIGAVTGVGFYWFNTKMNTMESSHSSEQIVLEMPDRYVEPDESHLHPRLRGLTRWERPEGPWRVALQVGHWRSSEAPDELKSLRVRTGTSYGSITEWGTALAIAQDTKEILESAGVEVDILPAVVPPNYWADVFISIHADGNLNSSISGFKVAAPWRDLTGKADEFAMLLEEEYKVQTKLRTDANITRAMRGYYAFNWRRYEHSLHPLTVAAIIETGFLTNASDRRVIVSTPEVSARGIANGVLRFLHTAMARDPDAGGSGNEKTS